MPIKDVEMVHVFMQSKMFFVLIPIIDIRGTSVFECPGDFLYFMPKQEDLNIMHMSSER